MKTARLVLNASLRDLARNRWIAGYTVGFFIVAEGLFLFSGSGPQVVLSLLNIVLLVVPLVALVFGTIHVYTSREFVELLLAQPLPRNRLFAGLYLGLAIPLAGAFLAGIAIPFALHLRSGASISAVLALLVSGVGLSLVFAGIATWIALTTDDRLKGVGAALGVWLVSTIVYDGAVLTVVASFSSWPMEKPMLALMVANPVDLARVIVLSKLDAAALMGYTGALFHQTFGTLIGAIVAGAALAAWCAVPVSLAARRFRSRDF